MLQKPAQSNDGVKTLTGWRSAPRSPSLMDVFSTIAVRRDGSLWRRLLAFLGPGYLVAVGYMDPGNWATSLAGGAKYGYALLAVALISNLMAIVLQSLCARLGVGAGRDLAHPSLDRDPRVQRQRHRDQRVGRARLRARAPHRSLRNPGIIRGPAPASAKGSGRGTGWTAKTWASITSDALRYCDASQSSAKCR